MPSTDELRLRDGRADACGTVELRVRREGRPPPSSFFFFLSAVRCTQRIATQQERRIRATCGAISCGRETLTLTGHSDAVYSVAFSPDGSRIVSGSYDGTLNVWNTDLGR